MSLHIEQIPGLAISDPDDFGQTGSMKFAVSQGAVTVTVGNSGVTITSGNGTATVVLSGTVSQFNKLIRGLTTGTVIYTNTNTGTKTLTITVTDATGQAGSISFPILVATAIPPVVTYSGSTVQANQGASVNMHGASKFSVTDSDALASLESMSVTSTDGTISITVGNSGVQLLTGNGTNSVSLRGTLASLNALLGGTSSGTVVFADSILGSKTFTVMVTDINNSSSSANATVVFGAPPVVTAPAQLTGVQSVNLTIHGTGFAVTDADDAGGTATCVITAGVGTVTVSVGNTSTTVTGGNGTASVTLTGTIPNVNKLLTATGGSTGTILGFDTLIQSSAISVTVTDSTSRVGSNNCALRYESSTPTWQGYAQATPKALVTGTLTAYPLFIDLSTLPNTWWAQVTSDGRDIRVTDVSNANVARHLVAFNFAAKTGWVVTKANMSTSPGALRIWCGTGLATAPIATDTFGQFNAYNSNIKAFWPDGAGTDATNNANNLTGVNGVTAGNAAGPFGTKSTTYDGISQYAVKASTQVAAVPVSFLTYYKSSQAAFAGLMCEDGSTGSAHYELIRTNTGAIRASAGDSGGLNRNADTATTGISGAFAAAAAVLASASVTAYDPVNGGSSTTPATGLASLTGTPETRLGSIASVGVSSNFFAGNLSCTMILNTGVTQNFSDMYQAMLSQSTFWGSWAFTATTLTGL